MGLREQIVKRIEAKQAEIEEHRWKMREAEAFLQGLQETLRLVPKDQTTFVSEHTLRPGTAISKARDVLKSAGKPLHITDLLKAMGKPVDKNSRVALSGSIAAYARKGEVFTKTAPNTFSLVSRGSNGQSSTERLEEPPDEFGLIPPEEAEENEIFGDTIRK